MNVESSGNAIGAYIVGECESSDGVCATYQMRHATLGTPYTMKVLKTPSHDGDEVLQLARIQASLRHPNLVDVVDVLTVEGRVALVLERIEGHPIDSWVGVYGPSLSEIESVFRGIVSGVRRAHVEALYFVDLTPQDVRVHSGPDGTPTAKITAFPIPVGHSLPSTVDRTSNVYALGCILYALCMGASPGSDAPSVDDIASWVPPRLRRVIEGCLAEHGGQFRSCEQILEALDSGSEPSLEFRTLGIPNLGRGVLFSLTLTASVVVSVVLSLCIVLLAGPSATTEHTSDHETPAPVARPAESILPVEPSPPAPEPRRVVRRPSTPPAPPPLDPAPHDAPKSVAEPSAEEASPVEPPPSGSVSAAIGAHQLLLMNDSRPYALGDVPVGTYDIMASFEAGQPLSVVGTVQVSAGSTSVLSCDAAFRICKVRR
ncbi:MAG: hypothetical protein KTR31_35965 [Myxococcales bacterium]|nr:hypothetical protein [Myxococcales bacterium]